MPRRSAAETKKALDDDTLVIKDAATLRALAEPMRMQILMELAEGPKTVKEVAGALEVGTTRLYYHFKILEKAKLIRVSGRRMISGIEERTYAATASSWVPAPEFSSKLAGSGIVDALLEVVGSELEIALDAQGSAPLGDIGSPVPVMGFTRLALAEDDVAEFQRRIESIMLEFGEPGPAPEGTRIYHALFAGYQAPTELRDRAQEDPPHAPPD